MKYPFQKLFLICTGERCNDAKNGEDRGEMIRAELKELNKKLGRKATVRVCATSCLDLCEVGPNMIAQPDATVYSHLTRQSARRAYDGEMGDGPAAIDVMLTPDALKRSRS